MSQRSLLGEFDLIAADPPWAPNDSLGARGAKANYPVMTTAEICTMPLPLIAGNAWLFMWRLASMQADALAVAKAWGFRVKSEIVWRKLTINGLPHFGMGRYVRATHETCLVCTRGSVKPANRSIRSVFEAPMPVDDDGKYIHSAKPDLFYKIVEQLTGSGLARAEMFARRRRKGWTPFGNEVDKFKEAP